MVSVPMKKHNLCIPGKSLCAVTMQYLERPGMLSELQAQTIIFFYEYELYAEPMWKPQWEARHTDNSEGKS